MSQNTKEAVIFIGPQGSGKATQSQILVEREGYVHIDIGGYMREFIRKNPDDALAIQIKSIMEHGHLLDDAILVQLFERALHEKLGDMAKLIVDGAARRVLQTEMILKLLKKEGFEKIRAILLDIPVEETLTRLKKRAVIESRADDSDEVKIHRRLGLYQQETLPVVPYLKSQGVTVMHVDGVGPISDVGERIHTALAQ